MSTEEVVHAVRLLSMVVGQRHAFDAHCGSAAPDMEASHQLNLEPDMEEVSHQPNLEPDMEEVWPHFALGMAVPLLVGCCSRSIQ